MIVIPTANLESVAASCIVLPPDVATGKVPSKLNVVALELIAWLNVTVFPDMLVIVVPDRIPFPVIVIPFTRPYPAALIVI